MAPSRIATPLLILLMSSPVASARVAPTTLLAVTKECDLIVTAKVTKFVRPTRPARLNGYDPARYAFATARVQAVWKGPAKNAPKEVRFRASAAGPCDESTAVKGETVLLFLVKIKGTGDYELAHSGHGRMPIRKRGDKTYAVWDSMIELPKGTPTVVFDRRKYWEGYLLIDDARLLVRKMLAAPPKAKKKKGR